MNKGKTALGMIRKGDIEGGAKLLAESKSWASLPGGGQEGTYTTSQMMKDFNQFFEQQKGAAN